jgi:hypothetical protein
MMRFNSIGPCFGVIIGSRFRSSHQGCHGIEDLAHALRGAVGKRDTTLAHLPLSWQGSFWHMRHPLDFVGSDGGGGVGGGPGISVGVALALKGSGRLPIAICGDGDFLMSVTSLWTAVHYRIPLLVVVANNRSFYNDEVHQERMAIMRNRPVDNKWIGQKMLDPEIDLAALARAQGARVTGRSARRRNCRRCSPRRLPRWMPARSPWSTFASSRGTAPAALWRARPGRFSLPFLQPLQGEGLGRQTPRPRPLPNPPPQAGEGEESRRSE